MFSEQPIRDSGLNYYSCATLIDITKTNAVRHYSNGMTESEADYNIKRNQHRNYQTILQVIGLRCQPTYLTDPILYTDQDLAKFGDEYSILNGNVWRFDFGVEPEGVFDLPNKPLGLLLDDMHNVPIITGLTESVKIETAMLDTANTDTRNTIILK